MTVVASFDRGAPQGSERGSLLRRDQSSLAPWELGDWLNLGLLGLAWIVAVILVDPRGEFPLIDDWAYRWSVDQLVGSGKLALSDWSATNLIGQVLWGSLFAKMFGAGFETLRFSTVTMGFIGGAALYVWLRTIHVRRAHALVGASSLLFNPIYFILSFTFMTDVPYVAAQTAAMVLLGSGLAGRSSASQAGGWLLALFALSIRQVGIAIPAGFGAALLWRDGLRWRSLALAVLPVLGFVAAQRGFEHWLAVSGRMPAQFGFNAQEIAGRMAEPLSVILVQAGNAVIYLFMYGGLLALPVVLIAYRDLVEGLALCGRLMMHLTLTAAALAIGLTITTTGGPMPIWSGILSRSGIGEHFGLLDAPYASRFAVTVAAAGGGAMGLVILSTRLWLLLARRLALPGALALVGAVVAGALLFGPLLVMPTRFDRYLLPLLPCLIVALLVSSGAGGGAGTARRRSAVRAALPVAAVLAGFAAFSIAGTRDFLAEGRSYRVALQHALALGHPRDKIDAGWVSNGHDLYGKVGAVRHVRAIGSWHNDPVIRLGFRSVYGYEVIARIAVSRSLPWARGVDMPMLVMRRLPGYGGFVGPPTYEPIGGPEFGYPHE